MCFISWKSKNYFQLLVKYLKHFLYFLQCACSSLFLTTTPSTLKWNQRSCLRTSDQNIEPCGLYLIWNIKGKASCWGQEEGNLHEISSFFGYPPSSFTNTDSGGSGFTGKHRIKSNLIKYYILLFSLGKKHTKSLMLFYFDVTIGDQKL